MEVNTVNDIPNDIEALKAALIAAQIHALDVQSKLTTVESELAIERAQRSDDHALIAHLKLMIAKMKQDPFGEVPAPHGSDGVRTGRAGSVGNRR